MSNSINLISNKSVELEKELRRLKKVKIAAVICLVAVVLMAVLVFVLNFTFPLDSVKKDQQLTMANLTAMNTKLTTYALTKDRVSNIANIIAQRGNFIPQTSQILSKVPSDLSVGTLEVTNGSLKITVSGASLASMNKFIDDVTILSQKKNIIQNVVVQQLSLDVKNNKYSISIQADIK